MDSVRKQLNNLLVKTDYFQEYLENLLSVLQPSYFCLDMVVRVLLHGPDGSGKRLLAKAAAEYLNMNLHEERVADIFDENIIGTEKKLRAALMNSATSTPCIIYLTGYELLCSLEDIDLERIAYCIEETLNEITSQNEGVKQPIAFIATVDDLSLVYSSPLSSIIQQVITIKPPTSPQAIDLINTITSQTELQSNPIYWLENSTNKNYYLGNIFDLIVRSEIFDKKSISKDSKFSDRDLYALKESEKTRWVDIGGLNEVKQEIINTIQVSIDYPQLKRTGLRRTGILLHGPPGTGKTLLSRAVANECGLNFINVKGPELLNEYVGQSENNVRNLFQAARESSPTVIFFDELDSLAPSRGQAGDSGGVMDRIVSQLLAEMDGVSKSDDVFVIGATNRVDLVDPSLQRPGRFDKVIEVPIPSTKESRIQILDALTRKLQLSPDVDINGLESKLKVNLSGADFQGLCSRAVNRSFNRCIEQLESGQKTEDEVDILVKMEDFLLSLND